MARRRRRSGKCKIVRMKGGARKLCFSAKGKITSNTPASGRRRRRRR